MPKKRKTVEKRPMPQGERLEGYCTVREAASALGISDIRIRQLICDNRIVAVRLANCWAIQLDSLAAYVSKPVGRPKGYKVAAGRLQKKIDMERSS